MRILFLTDGVFQDLPGGGRVVARELALGLTKRGHEVTFLAPRLKEGTPDEECVAEGCIVRYAGTGQGLRFIRAGEAACERLWAQGPFDITHTHFAYAALGPLRIVPRDVPHIRSFYGPWNQEAWIEERGHVNEIRPVLRPLRSAANRIRYRIRHWIEATNLRRSQAVIVLSKQSQGEVAELGYSPDQIHLIPAGVDLARFSPPKDKRAVCRALGLPEGRRVLLSIRRLTARMGLDRLIAAMPSVVARHPDVLLLIGGKGPEYDRLERMIGELSLHDHVRLIGFISEEQLAAYYGAADVFVLPTLALEGFGLVTLEALACGVPVIGTPIGATPELLIPLDTRLVTEDVTPEALSRSLNGFLDGEWADTLGPDRLRRYVYENYSWDQHVEAVEKLYRKCLEGSPIDV